MILSQHDHCFFWEPMQPTTRALSIVYKHTKQMHHVCVTHPRPPQKKCHRNFAVSFQKKSLEILDLSRSNNPGKSRKIPNKCKFPRFFTPTNPSWQISLPPFQTFRTFWICSQMMLDSPGTAAVGAQHTSTQLPIRGGLDPQV